MSLVFPLVHWSPGGPSVTQGRLSRQSTITARAFFELTPTRGWLPATCFPVVGYVQSRL